MSVRKWMLGGSVLGLSAVMLLGSVRAGGDKVAPAAKADAPKPAERPRVEVVFCLDTTGSMSGLIDAAKKKIWAISNQITTGKPTPEVKVGLVAYRDRGDEYVTKVFDITTDLDSIYTHLMAFTANGGGDGPESVNQALHDAVHKIGWSKDKKVLKMIFLVGDAPPHMDYPDDVKYPDTCKEAVKRDIIINTVLCGNDGTAKDHWVKMCRAAEGSFVQIDAGGGPVVAIATPFDKDLAALNTKISTTTIVWGRMEQQTEQKAQADKGAKLAAPDAAARAGFYARNSAGGVTYCLINSIKDGKVKLEDLKKEELPDQLKGKSLTEQKSFLAKVEQEREVLTKDIIALDKKRNEYIAKKRIEDAKLAAPDSFDANVLRILRTQAVRNGIEYAVEEEKK